MDDETIEYLKEDHFYEWVRVGKSRKSKSCCLCKGSIPAGTSQNGMRFYGDDGDFPVYWLCSTCEDTRKELIAELTTYKTN